MIRPLTPEEALKHTGELIRNIDWPDDWRGIASLCSVNKMSVYVKYIRPPFSGGGLLVSLEDFARDWKFEGTDPDMGDRACWAVVPDPRPNYRPFTREEALEHLGRVVVEAEPIFPGRIWFVDSIGSSAVVLQRFHVDPNRYRLKHGPIPQKRVPFEKFLDQYVFARIDRGGVAIEADRATCGVKLEEQ